MHASQHAIIPPSFLHIFLKSSSSLHAEEISMEETNSSIALLSFIFWKKSFISSLFLTCISPSSVSIFLHAFLFSSQTHTEPSARLSSPLHLPISPHTLLPPSFRDSFIRRAALSLLPVSLSTSVFDVSLCSSSVKNRVKMSLPVNYLSLEKIARYRHACSTGSPCATNKPIDIKPRGRRGYGSS